MAEITEIKIGQTLPPERWLEAADRMGAVFPSIANILERMDKDGRGKEDARDFMEDALLALVSLRFVGTCASEQCRFIAIPKKEGGGR